MPKKKSDLEPPIESPIPFDPCSNGEYIPRPPTERARRAEEAWRRIVEDKHRRLGVSRREFAESACGVAASLFVLNQLACSEETSKPVCPEGEHDGGMAARDGGGSIDAGGGMDARGGADAASGPDVSEADGGFFEVDAEMMEDKECAEALLYDPDAFVLDVQTHVSNPPLQRGWPEGAPTDRALDFLKQIFVQGGTTVACISGTPAARTPGEDNMVAREQLRELLTGIGGDRLRLHCNLAFNLGAPADELDYMEMMSERYPVAAWKVYPYASPWLANQEQGLPFAEKAAQLGVPIICAHRGIAGNGSYMHPGSPRDLVEAASQTPDVRYLCYHSGWESGTSEDHPFDPNAAPEQTFGIDRFVRALQEFGYERNTGNVYAELGSTWHNLRAQPAAAAHALGKLLVHLGEDRILFGTDSVFNGPPQGQIMALRAFQIPEAMRAQYGYPEITPEIRRKILGLNAAPLYGVDPMRARCQFDGDDVDALRLCFLDDPRSVPMPHPHRYIGPRNRREFFAFLRREKQLEHG